MRVSPPVSESWLWEVHADLLKPKGVSWQDGMGCEVVAGWQGAEPRLGMGKNRGSLDPAGLMLPQRWRLLTIFSALGVKSGEAAPKRASD